LSISYNKELEVEMTLIWLKNY